LTEYKKIDFSRELDSIKSRGELRLLSTTGSREGKWTIKEGKRYLNLSSNDYLGIAGDAGLHREFFEGLADPGILDSYGLGASSSRLLAGNHPYYEKLEDQINRLYGCSGGSVMVLSSGYHANAGIISALAGKEDVIFSDKANHASIIDGMRLSGADYYRYRHLDYNHLEDLLKHHRDRYRRSLIISETLFSMDGDLSDINILSEIKNRYGSLLYIDEAHAVGIFGEKGLGLCEATGTISEADVIIGTFGKALASSGAYAVCSSDIKNYLVNKARTFIFTTALPPVTVHWSSFVIDKVAEMSDDRKKLLIVASDFRNALKGAGFKTAGESQIVPVIIGKSEDTMELSDKLYENGYLALPVRPPTVPRGTSRLRISLNSRISLNDISPIISIMAGH